MLPCRSPETRKKLAQEYEIKPIAHVRLLNGQTRKSCTKDLITDSYYCFSYRRKNGTESGTFICGTYAANHFLELINHPKLPLFDPLVSETTRAGAKSESCGNDNDKEKWHPAARQLDNAINLLVVCWDLKEVNHVLQEIKTELLMTKNRAPYPRWVKAVNTIISRDRQGRTLQQMIEELRKNNKIRHFDFGLLNEILLKNNVEKSFYG